MNCMEKKLDLILSNIDFVSVQKCSSALVAEDAYDPTIEIIINLTNSSTNYQHLEPVYIYDYARGDYRLLYDLVRQIDWTDLEGVSDANLALKIFYDKVNACIDTAIPKRKCNTNRNKFNFKYPKYFSRDLKDKIRRKNNLHKIIQQKKVTFEQKNVYIEHRKQIKLQTNIEYDAYHTSIEFDADQDPNSFWKFIKSKTATKGIPSEMHIDNSILSLSLIHI